MARSTRPLWTIALLALLGVWAIGAAGAGAQSSPLQSPFYSPLPTPPWLPTAIAVATARAEATIEAAATSTPACCEGWWRIEDWMGQIPLWTDGTHYYVEGDLR